jgi:hypothetical protein
MLTDLLKDLMPRRDWLKSISALYVSAIYGDKKPPASFSRTLTCCTPELCGTCGPDCGGKKASVIGYIERRKRIGYGIDPATDKIVHEEYAYQRLGIGPDESDMWIDTGRRFDWWYGAGGVKRTRDYIIKPPFEEPLKPEPADWLPTGRPRINA